MVLKNICIKIIGYSVLILNIGFAQFSDQLEIIFNVNPEMKAAELAYQSALEKVKVAGVLPDPLIEGSISIEPIQTRNGPIDNQIMLGQKFPLWGKLRKERNIEKIKAEISRLNYENTKINIAYQWRKYSADYSNYKESLKILNDYQKELDNFTKIARIQYANGIGQTQHPIIKLQVEEALVRSQINNIESSLEETLNNLRVLYDGQFSENDLKTAEKLNTENFSKDHLLDIAEGHNPQYFMAQAQIAIANDQWKLSKLQNYPDLVAGLTYSIIGPTNLGGSVSSGQDAFGVKFGINIPLWFNKNRARVKTSSYILEQKKILLTDSWNKIESNVLSTLNELNEVDQTYKLYYESVINDTEQMLSSAYTAYENGNLDFLDLLDSIRLSSKVKLEFENIRARQTILKANLLKTVGLVYPN